MIVNKHKDLLSKLEETKEIVEIKFTELNQYFPLKNMVELKMSNMYK